MSDEIISPNFKTQLVTGVEFDLYNTLKSGPVVLNFIFGTWCPFCDTQLKKIRDWQEKMNKNITMLIVSSEPKDKIREWLNENHSNYIFASDPNFEVIELYSMKHWMMNSAKPATMLIDSDKTIRFIFDGIRTDKARKMLLDKINSNEFQQAKLNTASA